MPRRLRRELAQLAIHPEWNHWQKPGARQTTAARRNTIKRIIAQDDDEDEHRCSKRTVDAGSDSPVFNSTPVCAADFPAFAPHDDGAPCIPEPLRDLFEFNATPPCAREAPLRLSLGDNDEPEALVHVDAFEAAVLALGTPVLGNTPTTCAIVPLTPPNEPSCPVQLTFTSPSPHNATPTTNAQQAPLAAAGTLAAPVRTFRALRPYRYMQQAPPPPPLFDLVAALQVLCANLAAVAAVMNDNEKQHNFLCNNFNCRLGAWLRCFSSRVRAAIFTKTEAAPLSCDSPPSWRNVSLALPLNAENTAEVLRAQLRRVYYELIDQRRAYSLLTDATLFAPVYAVLCQCDTLVHHLDAVQRVLDSVPYEVWDTIMGFVQDRRDRRALASTSKWMYMLHSSRVTHIDLSGINLPLRPLCEELHAVRCIRVALPSLFPSPRDKDALFARMRGWASSVVSVDNLTLEIDLPVDLTLVEAIPGELRFCPTTLILRRTAPSARQRRFRRLIRPNVEERVYSGLHQVVDVSRVQTLELHGDVCGLDLPLEKDWPELRQVIATPQAENALAWLATSANPGVVRQAALRLLDPDNDQLSSPFLPGLLSWTVYARRVDVAGRLDAQVIVDALAEANALDAVQDQHDPAIHHVYYEDNNQMTQLRAAPTHEFDYDFERMTLQALQTEYTKIKAIADKHERDVSTDWWFHEYWPHLMVDD